MATSRWLLLGLCILASAGCTNLFLQPEAGHRWDPASVGIAYEDVWIESSDGVRLHAWLLPVEQGTRKGQVLFFHGNAENISTHLASVYWLPDQGYEVLLLDYRGFGMSDGRADIDGIHRDGEAALRWMLDRGARESLPTVLLGQSLGGAVALTVAARSGQRDNLAAVAADSAFSSYRAITREKFADWWLTWPLQWPLSLAVSDNHSPLAVVDRIAPTPVLLIAGERDWIVPPHHAERLHRAAGQPRSLWLLPDAGHIQSFADGETRVRFADWLDRVTECCASDATVQRADSR